MRLLLKNQANEQRLFRRRVQVGFVLVLLLFSILITRLIQLQILDHQRYSRLSRNNSIHLKATEPTRGLIYDRHGVLLAQNIPAFRLDITAEQITLPIESLLTQLGKIINLSEKEKERFYKRFKQARRFEGVALKLNLNEKEVATLMAELYRFDGVAVNATLIRSYPYLDHFAHTVGYVGRLSESELSRLTLSDYGGSEFIGKTGVEYQYQALLVGAQGYDEVEVDATGRQVQHYRSNPAIPGEDIYLTIDSRLQESIIEKIGKRRGAVVVLDPRNGDILSMVSRPSFDPNGFVLGWSEQAYQALQDGLAKPLFDRSIKGQYPPASTLKPFVALAGLETKTIHKDFQVEDPGWYQIDEDSRVYKDWRKQGHGLVSMIPAIAQSCDTYFYYLSHKMGIEKLSTWLKAFGFGQATFIDLPGERSGVVPSVEWKRATQGAPWYEGETLITGIGQGFLLATPLQLATATASLATGGNRIQPHLLKATKDEKENIVTYPFQQLQSIEANPTHLKTVIEGMEAVISSPKGTARRLKRGLRYTMAGKTGTAQVFGLKEGEVYNKHEIESHLRDHTLFIGFAPVNAPEVVVAVVLENEGGSSDLAKAVLDAYFDLKTE